MLRAAYPFPKLAETRVEDIARRSGIAVTPHVLRHTFAKRLVDAGVGLEKVAELLGHASIETTRIYTMPGEQDLLRAVETLE